MEKPQTGTKPPQNRVRRIPVRKRIPMMQAANRLPPPPPPLPFPFFRLPAELRLLIYSFVWTIDPIPHLVPHPVPRLVSRLVTHSNNSSSSSNNNTIDLTSEHKHKHNHNYGNGQGRQLKETYLHAQLFFLALLGRINRQIRREAYTYFFDHTQVYLRWDIKDLKEEKWSIHDINAMKLLNNSALQPLLRSRIKHVVWYWGFYGRVFQTLGIWGMLGAWGGGAGGGWWVEGPVTFGPDPRASSRELWKWKGKGKGKKGGKSGSGVEALERLLVDLAGQGQLETLEVVWDFKGKRVCRFLRRERRLLEVLERVVDASSGNGSVSVGGSDGGMGGEGKEQEKGKVTPRTEIETGRRRERARVSLRVEAREGEKFGTKKTEDVWEYLKEEESEVWERLERVVRRRDPEDDDENLHKENGVAIHQHLGALNPLWELPSRTGMSGNYFCPAPAPVSTTNQPHTCQTATSTPTTDS